MLKCFLNCKTAEDVEKIENLSPKESLKGIDDLKQLAILFCDYVKELDLSTICFIGHRNTDVDYLYLLFQKVSEFLRRYYTFHIIRFKETHFLFATMK